MKVSCVKTLLSMRYLGPNSMNSDPNFQEKVQIRYSKLVRDSFRKCAKPRRGEMCVELALKYGC